MTVILESGYTPGGSDQPATHARIAHVGNWFAGGTITASTTDSDYFTNAPDSSQTYQKWKPTAMPATWETDLGAAQDVDYCCIAAHNFGTAGTTLAVQYWTGAIWQPVVPATLITDNTSIMCVFSSVNAQRWRILLTGSTNPTVGVVRFGAALQMPRPIYGGHAPIDFNRNTVNETSESETGEFLGFSVLRVSLSGSFEWKHLEADWIRTNWGPAQAAFETDAVFIAWRPETHGEVGYGIITDNGAPTNMGIRDLMQVSLSMKGYASV